MGGEPTLLGAGVMVDVGALRRRLDSCVEARDRAEADLEHERRETARLSGQLRETYAELEEALDRASRAEQRVARLADLTYEAADTIDAAALDLNRLEDALPYANGRGGPRSLVAYARARRR